MKVVGAICLLVFLGVVTLGAGVYLTWEKWGKAKWEEIQAEAPVGEEEVARGTIEELPILAATNFLGAQRAQMVRVPLEVDGRSYARYMQREDVLVLVEYYADW